MAQISIQLAKSVIEGLFTIGNKVEKLNVCHYKYEIFCEIYFHLFKGTHVELLGQMKKIITMLFIRRDEASCLLASVFANESSAVCRV